MTKPIRVQRRRAAGWKLPENTVCVDRTSRWGNIFKVGTILYGEKITQERAVKLFRAALETGVPEMGFKRQDLWKLKRKNLACWCDLAEPCHADVLLEIVNKD